MELLDIMPMLKKTNAHRLGTDHIPQLQTNQTVNNQFNHLEKPLINNNKNQKSKTWVQQELTVASGGVATWNQKSILVLDHGDCRLLAEARTGDGI